MFWNPLLYGEAFSLVFIAPYLTCFRCRTCFITEWRKHGLAINFNLHTIWLDGTELYARCNTDDFQIQSTSKPKYSKYQAILQNSHPRFGKLKHYWKTIFDLPLSSICQVNYYFSATCTILQFSCKKHQPQFCLLVLTGTVAVCLSHHFVKSNHWKISRKCLTVSDNCMDHGILLDIRQ